MSGQINPGQEVMKPDTVKSWRRSDVERLQRMRPSDRGSSPTHEMEDD